MASRSALFGSSLSRSRWMPRQVGWNVQVQARRGLLASSKPKATPLGALLYVPASQDKFLASSLKTLRPALSSPIYPSLSLSSPNTTTYDLEDSIHPSGPSKREARERLSSFLQRTFLDPGAPSPLFSPQTPVQQRVAVRPNSLLSEKALRDLWNEGDSVGEGEGPKDLTRLEDQWGWKDLVEIWGTGVPPDGKGIESGVGWRWAGTGGPMMLLPKVDHPAMLTQVDRIISSMHQSQPHPKTQLIASIESPEAVMNLQHIASWRGRALELVGLTFAAEDFCASTHILRSPSRSELLFARSSIVVAARAFGLSAIDMVCVDYKSPGVVEEESEEGRRLGFDGKQAIHPMQVETIRKAFAPSEKEIHRAASILKTMNESSRGAETVVDLDGKAEMIDRPMVLQAQRIIREAKVAGLQIPDL